LRPDYFIQSGQFVHEVAAARSQGVNYVPYGERLREWESRMVRGLMQRRSRAKFTDTQEVLHSILLSTLEAIEDFLRARFQGRERRELLGLHLWARRPSERGLVLLGSSDRVWKVPQAMQAIQIRLPTIWVGVESFCRGRPVVQTIERELATRWKLIIGIPIFLDAAPWGRLPVGVMTLASDQPLAESVLGRLGTGLTEVLAPFLAQTAREVLTP
jgi:hypothetical protein